MKVFWWVSADRFLAMLLDEQVDAFSQIRYDILPHLDLLFLDFGHGIFLGEN
jgi:hypothetical protein